MFEQTKEQMTARMWIDEKDSRLSSQYACDIPAGWFFLTWEQAGELIAKMRRMELSVYPANLKRFRSIYRQIAASFGPEGFEEFLK